MKNEDMIAEIAARAKHIQETNGRYTAFEIFQSKWYARVLFELCQKNPSRFGELKKAIPEISNVVLFLASDDASYVNDSIIKVNGGSL